MGTTDTPDYMRDGSSIHVSFIEHRWQPGPLVPDDTSQVVLLICSCGALCRREIPFATDRIEFVGTEWVGADEAKKGKPQ